METYVFIILHLSYVLFLMLLVTSLSKHGSDDKMKKLLNYNNDDIFIPENPTYNELYASQLNESNKSGNTFIKRINIIPYGDKLVSKNGLYDLLSTYYKNDYSILDKIVPRTYILQNDIDKKQFDKDFYKNFPNKIYILKKNIDRKEGLKIFKIKEKENLIDLYETYNNEDYKLVQEYEKNQYLYQNKIVILRVYLLIVRQGNSLKFIKQKWIKCLYSKYDYNLKNIKSMISDSTFNSPNFPKNLKELFMDNDIIYNNINQQINDIFFKIKNASKDLLTNNNILNKCVLFQLYGCDFVIDNNLNVRLLEINKNPNLINNFNNKEENIKKNMINDIYSYIKKL